MDEDGFNLLEGSMEKNTEEYFGMKKVKYIILVAVAGILIFCCCQIIFAPHSYRDVVSREIDNIQPSINTSSFESLSVQKFNDTKYYLDENNALWFKSPKEEKICVRQVAYFLVWQNRLIYTTTNNIKCLSWGTIKSLKRGYRKKQRLYFVIINFFIFIRLKKCCLNMIIHGRKLKQLI